MSASAAASQAATTAPASSSGAKAADAPAAEAKKPEPVAPTDKQVPGSKSESTQEKKEQLPTQVPEVSILKVPSEGFKFGPSKSSGPPAADKKVASQVPASRLRPTATAFVPPAVEAKNPSTLLLRA
jgi:hypothetical protein